MKNLISSLEGDEEENKKYLDDFKKAMDDDLNTPKALQSLWGLVRDPKARGKILTIKKMDEVFGFNLLKFEKVKVPKEIQRLADEREKARKEKKWKLADELREKINKLDFVLEDSPNGPILKRK